MANCEYCNQDNTDFLFDINVSVGTSKNGINVCASISEDKPQMLISIFLANEDITNFYMPINYCPICGQKLLDRESEEQCSTE